jgi:hypothetical protein
MPRWRDDDVIELLACDVEARPEAPGPEALAPFVTGATHGAEVLSIYLDDTGQRVAEAFVEAERICCSNIDWALATSPRLTLTIRAEPRQLSVLRGLIPSHVHIEEVQ